MVADSRVLLKPVVCFRESMSGPGDAPSMRTAISDVPWPDQDGVLGYLRSGYVYGMTFGGMSGDHLEQSRRITVDIDGEPQPAGLLMTDGEYFWYSALIYYIDNYNLQVPDEFIEQARRHDWRVDLKTVSRANYDFDFQAKSQV